MTTLKELHEGLSSIYPTRYSHFSSPQKPPFICYVDNGTDPFFADNKVLIENTYISIELYTKTKDLEAEKKIKQFLNENELPYIKSSSIYIETEEIYKTNYEVSI